MARPPLTRIDGEPAQGVAAPPPSPSGPPPSAKPRGRPAPRSLPIGAPVIARLVRRAPAPQIWLGAGCLLVLLIMLAAGRSRDETQRSPLDRAPNDAAGPIVATLQVPGADTRPVRLICDDQGLPAELCARSAACAPDPPPMRASAPRVVRLFLRLPANGGCS